MLFAAEESAPPGSPVPEAISRRWHARSHEGVAGPGKGGPHAEPRTRAPMKWEQFLTGYHPDAVNRMPLPGIGTDLFRQGREYATRWGKILYDRLGHGTILSSAAFNRLSLEYSAWTKQLEAMIRDGQQEIARQIADDPAFGNAYAAEIAFHRLHGDAQWSWVRLVEHAVPDALLDKIILKSRFDLACKTMQAQSGREMLVGQDVFFTPDAVDFRGWSTGALTEMDAYVALLELSARNPRLVVVPGPPQFEQLAGASNADFLVIDLDGQRIRGVQVKTTARHGDGRRYDPARITLVDGVTDLHNVRAMRTDPRRSDKKVVPWPGLVSAHFIRDLPMNALDGLVERTELIQKKLAARHHTGTIASRNELAFATIGERVLYDMIEAARTPAP